MHSLICPVCKQDLEKENRTYKCSNNHCFDIAKQGYVNLLQSQQSKLKRHGDDKLMINSRTAFLDKGYYKPLQKEICQKLLKHLGENPVVLDAGCGDCYYKEEKKSGSSGYRTGRLSSGEKIMAVCILLPENDAGYAAIRMVSSLDAVNKHIRGITFI